MAARKVILSLSREEALAIADVLATSDLPAAGELAAGFADLGSGRVASLETTTEEPSWNSDLTIVVGQLHIDILTRTVHSHGRPVQLTPKEFDILVFLARNRGVLFTKEQIYRAVWGEDYLLDDSNIMAFIRKLRKKIEPEPDSPRYIITVWGIGYKMADL